CTLEQRRYLKTAAAIGVDERGENRGRIEMGQAEEIDRPVHPHQGDGIEITDDAVFAQRCVTPRHRLRRIARGEAAVVNLVAAALGVPSPRSQVSGPRSQVPNRGGRTTWCLRYRCSF